MAPSKGYVRAGTFPPLPEERNRFSSRNGVPFYIVPYIWNIWRYINIQTLSVHECNITLSEPFAGN